MKVLSRFEPVEWLYDGLKGKIIPWTKEHGGKSDDPSIQAFVVGMDGKVFASSAVPVTLARRSTSLAWSCVAPAIVGVPSP